VDVGGDDGRRLASGHLHVEHGREIADAERAHLLDHDVGERAGIVARLEELVGAAKDAGRLHGRPVLVELGVHVRAVVDARVRPGDAGGLHLVPVDVALELGDVDPVHGGGAGADDDGLAGLADRLAGARG